MAGLAGLSGEERIPGGEIPLFVEEGGVVELEAEAGMGNWKVIDFPGGQGIEDPGKGSRMEYRIRFGQAGRYFVWLRAKQGPLGRDKQNDVSLVLGGEKLFAADGVLRPDGMRSYGDWKWTQWPKGPGSHTPRTIWQEPVYFLVPEPGEYVFEIRSRSEGFAIDRVLMRREDPGPPEDGEILRKGYSRRESEQGEVEAAP